jgi:hypothetical protein
LVERFVYTEDVRSSSLLSPTINPPYYYNPCKYDYCYDIKVIVTKIEWKDYPKTNLRFIRNVWVVEVSIPTSLQHLFGNGSKKNNGRRKATGTTDKAIADKRITELAHKIYKEFDEAQLEYANRNNRKLISMLKM